MKAAKFAILFLIVIPGLLWAKPKGESTLVGAVLLEFTGSYPGMQGPLTGELQVRVVSQYLNKKGKEKEYTYTIRSDSLGYFKIENVPAGQYLLKAMEVNIGRASRITVASKYGRGQQLASSRYWGMMNGSIMDNLRDMLSDHFQAEPQQGVIDLGITYIQIQANEQASGTGMRRLSPDGQPPWQRMSVSDRASIIDLFMLSFANFPELTERPLGEKKHVYTRPAPSAYFNLQVD